jgi:hypothetical protein
MAAFEKSATAKGFLLIARKPTMPRRRRPTEKSMSNEGQAVGRSRQWGFGEQLRNS